MSLVDIIIAITLVAFAYFGYKSGLIQALGSVVGTILGIYVASHYYEPLAKWLINFTHWNENFVRIVVFIILFVISNRLVGIVFWAANKLFGILARLPILGSLDRLLGAGFGLIEGVIVVGIALFFVSKFPPSPAFMEAVEKSKMAKRIVPLTSFLWPLLDENVLQAVTSFTGGGMPNVKLPALPKEFKIPEGFSTSALKFR